MKKILNSILKFLNKYTTGVPFIIWSVGCTAVGVFVIIFRNSPNFQFDKLIYLLAISPIYFIVSDILKKREFFHRRIHFIIDSIFYLTVLSAFVFFTGGYKSDLYFVFFLGVISAPLFGTIAETIIFTVALSSASFYVHYISHYSFHGYELGVIITQSFFYFLIAGVIKFSLEMARRAEAEKRFNLETIKNDLELQVAERTKQLANVNVELEIKVKERTSELEHLRAGLEETVVKRTFELEKKVDELERLNKLTIDRELRMIELKREVAGLKK
jgi:hypothetical protein